MINWRETCRECGGAGHWIAGDRSICTACDGVGHRPIPGAPGFHCPTTLADRNAGDVVVLGTGEKVRILFTQPRKTKRVRPITTFVGVFSSDFGGDELELGNPIPLPSSFGVLEVVRSRVAGDESDGKGDASDPLARRAHYGRGELV